MLRESIHLDDFYRKYPGIGEKNTEATVQRRMERVMGKKKRKENLKELGVMMCGDCRE